MDGALLSELLLNKGYEVHGIVRRSSSFNTGRIEHLYPKYKGSKLFLHYGDLTDGSNISRIIEKVQPQEIYGLGAQSHVKISFDIPEYSAQVDAIGTLRLLDAIKSVCPLAKYYNAATSELFGKVQEVPQTEKTPFYPRSPYGAAKLFSYWVTINYREAYSLFACNGILFNHEHYTRGENFVTRKITISVAKIAKGLQDKIQLGNLSAQRDWGWAPDYIEGMYMMLQQPEPDDFVLATGEMHSVEEFCTEAFEHAGMPLEFSGEGVDRKGYDSAGNIRVEVNPKYFRPTDVEQLLGDASKAKRILGWEPKVKFDELVKLMTDHDINATTR